MSTPHHPRCCGETSVSDAVAATAFAPPPLLRGSGIFVLDDPGSSGSTPAVAGKPGNIRLLSGGTAPDGATMFTTGAVAAPMGATRTGTCSSGEASKIGGSVVRRAERDRLDGGESAEQRVEGVAGRLLAVELG